MDKRVAKTEEDLYNAILNLISVKSYHDITINDLCKEAHIKRPTFYNHYKDKDDFITHALSRYYEVTLENNYSLKNFTFREYFFTILEAHLYTIDSNRKRLAPLINNSDLSIIKSILNDFICSLLLKKYNTNNEYNLDDLSKEILIRGYAGIFVNITYYVAVNEQINIDELIDKLGDLSYKVFFNKN